MIMTEKLKHIMAGALIAGAVGIPCYINSNDLFAGLWACLAGVIAGIVKEWCDNNTEGNEWNWRDLGYTCIGVAVAMLVVIGLHFGRG